MVLHKTFRDFFFLPGERTVGGSDRKEGVSHVPPTSGRVVSPSDATSVISACTTYLWLVRQFSVRQHSFKSQNFANPAGNSRRTIALESALPFFSPKPSGTTSAYLFSENISVYKPKIMDGFVDNVCNVKVMQFSTEPKE